METKKCLLYSVILLLTVHHINCLPTWGVDQCQDFSEDLPVGTWLFNLTATTDIPGAELVFSTDNALTHILVNLTEPWISATDQYTAGVILYSELDRDFTPNPKHLQFAVSDTDGPTTRGCVMNVHDVNDNPPIFQNLPYNVRILEDIVVGTVVFGNISFYDPDGGPGGSLASLAMVHDVITSEKFALNWILGTGTASIRLISTLDYEVRNSYTVMLMAADGEGLSSSVEILISVDDVQDSPPYFLQPMYRTVIQEHSPAGISVIQIQAEDGDRGIPRSIEYTITTGKTEFFAIDVTTGWITQTVSLDREDPIMRDINGVFAMIVQANEVNSTAAENARSDIEVTVTIEDINDNPPTFNTSSTYTAYVRDDTPSDSLIYFDGAGYMQVSDLDQGLNAYFMLSVEKDGEEFTALQASPVEVYFEAFVLIRIINSSVIREYSGQHLVFDVIAQETRTAERKTGTAVVVLTIETTEEPTTTPPPPEENALTAPDIVVFVVGFLVILNIATSVIICYLMTRKRKNRSQGLARNGSKYYVTVHPKTPGLSVAATESSSNGVNSTSVMQEIP